MKGMFYLEECQYQPPCMEGCAGGLHCRPEGALPRLEQNKKMPSEGDRVCEVYGRCNANSSNLEISVCWARGVPTVFRILRLPLGFGI